MSYCTVSQVKERCLIAESDTQYDSAISAAIQEASRLVDDYLRPYMRIVKQVTLSSTSYIPCVDSDIGKPVLEDGIEVGFLISFNNSTRTWLIRTSWNFTVGKEIMIRDGLGKGFVSSCTSYTSKEPLIFSSLPLDPEIIPDELKYITADLAAALFQRRYFPQSMDQGYFAQGLKKLQDFIDSHFIQGKVVLGPR